MKCENERNTMISSAASKDSLDSKPTEKTNARNCKPLRVAILMLLQSILIVQVPNMLKRAIKRISFEQGARSKSYFRNKSVLISVVVCRVGKELIRAGNPEKKQPMHLLTLRLRHEAKPNKPSETWRIFVIHRVSCSSNFCKSHHLSWVTFLGYHSSKMSRGCS